MGFFAQNTLGPADQLIVHKRPQNQSVVDWLQACKSPNYNKVGSESTTSGSPPH